MTAPTRRLLAWLNDDGPDHPDWRIAVRVLAVWTTILAVWLAVLLAALALDTTHAY